MTTAAGTATPARGLAVVGTAGHIDHGKTALVRRLTGIDTDRLPEEKKRGISIDLGFAHLVTPAGRHVGIVDVPGHERFVRNMLAGVGGIDLVWLVIAADEGVMPQTREHLAIVKLLNVKRGLVVLTKSDLVQDAEWRALVERDVASLVEGSFLEGAPVVRFSAVTGEGVDRLLAELDRALAEAESRPVQEPARLPVDRSFVVEGVGTVVTGTLWRGRIRTGDTLLVLPGERSVRVRSLQVHGAQVEEACAGQRTAVALHGVSREEVGRGDWLVAPKTLQAARRLSVRLELLPEVAKALRDRARLRFHLGAAEILGRVRLLEGTTLAPGAAALAQLELESAAVAARGDRFVVRSYSPSVTIGGGTVLEPGAGRRKRGDVRGLATAEEGSEAERLLEELARGGLAARSSEALARATDLARERVAALLEELAAGGQARALPGERWAAGRTWTLASERLTAALAAYAEQHPIRWGRAKGELKSALGRDVEGALFDAVLADLAASGAVEARGDEVRLAGRGELSPGDRARLEKVVAAVEAEGFSVPELAKLPARSGVAEAGEFVQRLLFEGGLVRVSQEFAYTAGQWRAIRERLGRHFASQPSLQVADLKTLLGISRKHAIPLLEYTDRIGYTLRVGDGRQRGPRL
jgi:selenocysteine-specific elongation factor